MISLSVPFFWQILPILRAVLVLGSEKSRDDDNYPKKNELIIHINWNNEKR